MDSQTYKYEEALQWLFSQLPMFSRVGGAAYKPGLDTTERLDEIYGNPHRKFKAIHVAGTNGKGSTSHMIASVLQAQGYKTGLYTSPHLTDFRERMRINGEMIPKEEVVRFVANWKSLNSNGPASGLRPSFFELTMMMAFDWFAREKVDFAVIEVGMGGRLDSTNVISPILSIITNISLDHTQFLGTTLRAIAGEKAGIIKEGVPVVIGETIDEIIDVFIAKASEAGAPVILAQDSNLIKNIEAVSGGFCVLMENGLCLNVPLAGAYQRFNIRTALCALHTLEKTGVELSDKSIKEGLESVVRLTGLRGRWQTVRENPTVICDTGHNLAGIKETMASLHERFPGKKIKFVVGFVNDKDVAHIVGLFPQDGEYFFTRADIPRAMPSEEVASCFRSAGIVGESFSSVKEAYDAALSSSSPDDIIYVGGSTFIVADFLKFT